MSVRTIMPGRPDIQSNKYSDFISERKHRKTAVLSSQNENLEANSHHGHSNLSKPKKAFILLSSLLGTTAALAIIGKQQKLNVFKLSELKKVNFEAKEIIYLAAGSVIGGLSSGFLVDRTNKRDKFRESIQQFVGNIIFPISFVFGANKIWQKASKNVKLPQLSENSTISKRMSAACEKLANLIHLSSLKKINSVKIINAVIKSLPDVAATFIGLGAGILVGNKAAVLLNNKIFKENQERKIKISDFAAHVDDTLIGATLVANNVAESSSIIGSTASKLIPPALVVPGYMAGTAQ